MSEPADTTWRTVRVEGVEVLVVTVNGVQRVYGGTCCRCCGRRLRANYESVQTWETQWLERGVRSGVEVHRRRLTARTWLGTFGARADNLFCGARCARKGGVSSADASRC